MRITSRVTHKLLPLIVTVVAFPMHSVCQSSSSEDMYMRSINDVLLEAQNQRSFRAYTDHPIHMGMMFGIENNDLSLGLEMRNILSPFGWFTMGSLSDVPKASSFSCPYTVSSSSSISSVREHLGTLTFGTTIDLFYNSEEHRNKVHLYLGAVVAEKARSTSRTYVYPNIGEACTHTSVYLQRSLNASALISYTFVSESESLYLSVYGGNNFATKMLTFGICLGMLA